MRILDAAVGPAVISGEIASSELFIESVELRPQPDDAVKEHPLLASWESEKWPHGRAISARLSYNSINIETIFARSASRLRTAYVEFSVVANRATEARRVFDRSAPIAGFFSMPSCPLIIHAPREEEQTASAPTRSWRRRVGREEALVTRSRRLHPFIEGMLETMPEPHGWPLSDRANWLRATASIFAICDKAVTATVKPGASDASVKIEEYQIAACSLPRYGPPA